MTELPVIDVGPLVDGDGVGVASVGDAIDRACREVGFFSVVGHGIDPALAQALEDEARAFFALGEDEKAEIAMARGGRAWRGWFPVDGELTSGRADAKEGLYFGAELGPDDPRVRAGVPLHGANLFPARPAGLRAAVLAYLDAMTALGHALVRGVAMGLGLDPAWFDDHLTADPTVLFRIFRYPPGRSGWGVGEHSDYGLLTILRQDEHSGLEVRTPSGWALVPPMEGSFVCNLGDMLDRMTGGRYRSTPHRVRNRAGVDRLSLAFFFDPAWEAAVAPIPLAGPAPAAADRWDGTSLEHLSGSYGAYLSSKVTRVFPELGRDALGTWPTRT